MNPALRSAQVQLEELQALMQREAATNGPFARNTILEEFLVTLEQLIHAR